MYAGVVYNTSIRNRRRHNRRDHLFIWSLLAIAPARPANSLFQFAPAPSHPNKSKPRRFCVRIRDLVASTVPACLVFRCSFSNVTFQRQAEIALYFRDIKGPVYLRCPFLTLCFLQFLISLVRLCERETCVFVAMYV